MNQCKTCGHRTAANSCAHLLAERGGVHWCSDITECDAHTAIDNTERHMCTLTRLTPSKARTEYLADVGRAEGPEARQRLEAAFLVWWETGRASV